MPPRRSTRSSDAPSRSSTRRRRRDDDDDDADVEEEEEVQHQNGGDDEQEEEEDAPVRRSSRRQPSRASSSSQRTYSQRKVSAGRRRRGAADDDDDDEDEEEEQEEQEEEDDEDADVTITGSRKGKGRKSNASARDDDGSDAEEGVAAKWKMLEKTKQGELSAQIRSAAKEMGKQEVLKKAADLCRMALYHEYSKGPLRRPAINAGLFNSDSKASRAFPMVLRYTNKTLRGTFALELVELRTGASASSNAYILRNVLPEAAIEGLVKPCKELRDLAKRDAELTKNGRKRQRSSAAAAEGSSQLLELAGAEERKKYVGHRSYDKEAPMLDWKAADGQLGSMGLLYVILALILTNGRTLPNNQLRSALRRLCLPSGEPLPTALRIDGNVNLDAPFPSRSSLGTTAPKSVATEANNATIESFLANAVKMHYLEHAKSSTLAGAATQTQGGASGSSGRGRRSANVNLDGEGGGAEADAFDWRWGPRATIEVGEVGIAKFISEVWGLGASQQDEDEEQAAAAESQLLEEGEDEDEDEDEDGDGDEAGGSSSRRRQKRKASAKKSATQNKNETAKERHDRLMRDIERAAGSQLI
ncbi:hypothetical protein OC835_001536 [Tilletia horrida]|nr:hypothetical protein OC835_001536 [Tilletia horrida]